MKYEIKMPYCDARIFDDEYDAAELITTDSGYIDAMDVNIDEILDDSYGTIEICGRTFYASEILQGLNEDAYSDFAYREREELAANDRDWVAEQIRRLCEGESTSFGYNITVTAIEDYDEEDEQGDADLHCVLEFE